MESLTLILANCLKSRMRTGMHADLLVFPLKSTRYQLLELNFLRAAAPLLFATMPVAAIQQ